MTNYLPSRGVYNHMVTALLIYPDGQQQSFSFEEESNLTIPWSHQYNYQLGLDDFLTVYLTRSDFNWRELDENPLAQELLELEVAGPIALIRSNADTQKLDMIYRVEDLLQLQFELRSIWVNPELLRDEPNDSEYLPPPPRPPSLWKRVKDWMTGREDSDSDSEPEDPCLHQEENEDMLHLLRRWSTEGLEALQLQYLTNLVRHRDFSDTFVQFMEERLDQLKQSYDYTDLFKPEEYDSWLERRDTEEDTESEPVDPMDLPSDSTLHHLILNDQLKQMEQSIIRDSESYPSIGVEVQSWEEFNETFCP